jgi:transcriptional regulator with XRE-family HTH domain
MAKLRAEQESAKFNARYGQAIRSLREARGLKQSDIKGLEERTVRRIEKGETRATVNALAKLAEAHEVSLTDYLGELAKTLQT